MEIVIDIETLPGDLNRRDEDMAHVAETTTLTCNLKKGELVEALGDPQLKYKTVDELKPMWIEANKEAAIEEAYRKRALDGTYGQVCSIVYAIGEADPVAISLKTYEREYDVLRAFVMRLEATLTRSDSRVREHMFIGHNIVFDLNFLFRRLVINQVLHNIKLPFGGWHDKDFYCTSQAWCGREGRISQDNLCKALGIEGKPEGISGSNVYDHALAGNWDGIEEYNIDDVVKCREIYKRLKR